MKILHTISQFPGKTGSGIYLQALMKEGYKKGYDQALIAGISNGQNLRFDCVKGLKIYPVVFETEELPFPIVGMSDVMPYKSTKYSEMDEEMFKLWEKAFRKMIDMAIDEFNPDIIISHHLWTLSSFIKRNYANIPMASISHGTDLRQLKNSPRYKEYVLKGCKNIDMIFALNEFQKKEIIKEYDIDEEKVRVIGGGYDSSIFYPKENKKTMDKLRLVYAGKLSFSKGIPSLIKAYNKLDMDKDSIELIIVGSGSGNEERKIKEAAKSSRYKIIFTGEVPQKKVGDIFRKCDIFILPSYYEGLSLVTIEALACGLKVVATEIPGLKSWLGDEINNSGIIEYVELPKMFETDIPEEEELPKFEKRLKAAIEKQIYSLSEYDSYKKDENVSEKIRKMSWSGIFENIEDSFGIDSELIHSAR